MGMKRRRFREEECQKGLLIEYLWGVVISSNSLLAVM